MLERAEFHQANRGRELRLIESGFKAVDGIGFAERGRQLEDSFGDFLDSWNARPAATDQNTGPQIMGQFGLPQFLFDQFKDLLDPKGHDAAKMLHIDGFDRKADFVIGGDRLPFVGLFDEGGAMFNFSSSARPSGIFKP